MNSGHKADAAADAYEARTTYAVIEPGPVLKCYERGSLVIEAKLSPREAVHMAVQLLREVRV